MRKLFGTDGIRGIAAEELTAELAMQVGRSLAAVLKDGGVSHPRIMIGMDTRLSSDMLASALESGICSAGADALNVGVCSTPAVAYLLMRHSCDGGVMISASHNPYEYNGIKLFGSDGFKLSDEAEERIEEMIEASVSSLAPVTDIGRIYSIPEAIKEYEDYLAEAFGVDLCGLKIGLDCANGSAYRTAPRVLKRLGAECTVLADMPNGININLSCGSTHLDGLKRLVREKGLDLGLAFDGDADRCLAIDENGNEVDGDYIMAILALRLRDEGRLYRNTLVGTVMTNLGLGAFCRRNGLRLINARVGDRYVLEIMNKEGYSLGGEQSGHIIMREHATTGDGQLTAIALLSHIKESGKSLSTLASVMKKYPQFTVNINATQSAKEAIASDQIIRQTLADAEKEIGEGGRILVRPSGTEPLIRIMTEGEDAACAEGVCRSLSEKIEMRLSELGV